MFVISDLLLLDSEFFFWVVCFLFFELVINENYSGLNQGKNNEMLVNLVMYFLLMLVNFGVGEVLIKVIFDGFFK